MPIHTLNAASSNDFRYYVTLPLQESWAAVACIYTIHDFSQCADCLAHVICCNLLLGFACNLFMAHVVFVLLTFNWSRVCEDIELCRLVLVLGFLAFSISAQIYWEQNQVRCLSHSFCAHLVAWELQMGSAFPPIPVRISIR